MGRLITLCIIMISRAWRGSVIFLISQKYFTSYWGKYKNGWTSKDKHTPLHMKTSVLLSLLTFVLTINSQVVPLVRDDLPAYEREDLTNGDDVIMMMREV